MSQCWRGHRPQVIGCESLRAGILHDVPELLKSMGAEVGDELDLDTAQSDAEALQQFKMLPKMFSGRPVFVEFATRGNFTAAYPDSCSALGLEIGADLPPRLPPNEVEKTRF